MVSPNLWPYDMTLVVARLHNGKIAVVADTQLIQHDMTLPPDRGAIKTCFLPGDLCVSFSNSPELAAEAFKQFCIQYPNGATFVDAVEFFETSSADTENEYILSFFNPAKLVKIVDGKRAHSVATTVWIGDKLAYERFREYETHSRPFPQRGRAINTALFMDEMSGSSASDLYATMRNVIVDPEISSVGGFAYAVSSRGNGYRQSVYCDILYDWPTNAGESFQLDLNDPIDLGASGENSGYSVAQISSGYIGVNLVGFYLIKGRKLFFYYGLDNGLPVHCHVFNDIEAREIKHALTAALGVDLNWLVTVATSSEERAESRRAARPTGGPQGLGISLLFHENSFSKGS